MDMNEKITIKRYIRFLCNKEREKRLGTIHKGEVVYGDITSLYTDIDGDTYIQMYDAFGENKGYCNLNRFQTII